MPWVLNLRRAAAANIPVPSVGHVTLFVDEADGLLKMMDETGTIRGANESDFGSQPETPKKLPKKPRKLTAKNPTSWERLLKANW